MSAYNPVIYGITMKLGSCPLCRAVPQGGFGISPIGNNTGNSIMNFSGQSTLWHAAFYNKDKDCFMAYVPFYGVLHTVKYITTPPIDPRMIGSSNPICSIVPLLLYSDKIQIACGPKFYPSTGSAQTINIPSSNITFNFQSGYIVLRIVFNNINLPINQKDKCCLECLYHNILIVAIPV